MRALALAVALVGLLLCATAALARHAPSTRAPARLLVSGQEYSLVLSRGSVKHGPVLIQFLNRGEDPHDLRLRRIGRSATRTVSAAQVGPGRLVQLEARLRAGRYNLWCSLPEHRRRGMHAVLTVRGGR
jgi:hypothetical protein